MQKPEKLIYPVCLKGAKEPCNRINITFEPGEQGRHNVNVLCLLTTFMLLTTSCSNV